MKRREKTQDALLSLVIPVYNEALILEKFFDLIKPTVAKLEERNKVFLVFVDNGSTDGTYSILANGADDFRNFGVLKLTRNFGYETAIIAGLTHVISDFYAVCDSDGEDPIELFTEFQSALLSDYDVAIGIRRGRHENFLTRKFREFSYILLSRVSDEPFVVNAGNFSMFKKVVRDIILKENNSFPFMRASLSRSGYKTARFIHNRNPRLGGMSKYRKIPLLKFALAGFLTTTTWPLRLVSYLSLILFSLLPMITLSAILINRLATAHLFVALLTFYSSIIVLALGILAMYLARVYKNSLGRPLFYVDWNKSYVQGQFNLNLDPRIIDSKR